MNSGNDECSEDNEVNGRSYRDGVTLLWARGSEKAPLQRGHTNLRQKGARTGGKHGMSDLGTKTLSWEIAWCV